MRELRTTMEDDFEKAFAYVESVRSRFGSLNPVYIAIVYSSVLLARAILRSGGR